MKTKKIIEYLKKDLRSFVWLILQVSIAVALFLLIRPFIQPLIDKLILFMTSSQISVINFVIVALSEIMLSFYLAYSILTYIGKQIGKAEEVKD